MYWEADEIDAAAPRGTTRPAFLRCLAQNAPTEKCAILLVKSGLSDDQYVSEYVANRMADEVGIPTPKPGVVRLSEKFVQESANHPDAERIRVLPGWAVGSQKLTGLAELAMPLQLAGEEREQGQRLFALDIIGQQSDRKTDNPNAGKWKGRLMAFDFQLEFQIGWQDLLTPGEVHRSIVEANRRNPFRRTIDASTDLESVLEPFKRLDENWFDQISQDLPESWRTYAMAIGRHTLEQLRNKDKLIATMLEATDGSY